MKEERKPDLVGPDEEALEERVDEMLSPAPKPKVNKIEVKHHDDTDSTPKLPPADDSPEPTGVPVVPGKKKPKEVKISITHHEDEVAPDDASPEAAPTEQSDSLEALIAEANEKLSEELPGPPPVEGAGEDTTPQEPLAEAQDAVDEQPSDEPGMPDLSPEAAPATDDETPLPDTLDDPQTDKAVADIVTEEGDKLLEVDAGDLPEEDEGKLSFGEKVRGLFGIYFRSKLARWVTLFIVLGLVGAAGAVPTSRYYLLNTAGVRSSASVAVTDQSTFQPLKNVRITIADQSALTDENGKVTLKNLKLGGTQLMLEKYAYSPITQHVTVGWGSNPFGSFKLAPTGSQYTIKVVDYLSGKPVAKAQAVAGKADAQSDDKGVVKLSMDHVDATTVDAVVTADGYREEHFTLSLVDSKQETDLRLVPANKAVYISKRSGKYDVYAKYIDGKDEQKILSGTGNEQDNMVLVPSLDGKAVALVSTRDNQHNSDGFLLSTLTMINLAGNTTKTVTHSEQVYIVGWAGTRLVYVQTAAGASAANPNRQRLMSYDYGTGDNHQLASTNYFNDVLIVNGKIYYAPSSTYQAAGVAINFFSINPDGSNKQTVLAQEAWSAYRVGHDEIVLSSPNQQWYSYKLSGAPTKLDGAPGSLVSRVYVDSPDATHSLWVDLRDGKGVLLSYDTNKKADTAIQTKSGLTTPVRWLNSTTVVYRVKSDQETADYAVNIEGGNPQKIADVTNTGGIDKWYYY
jgi:hypothetical protein